MSKTAAYGTTTPHSGLAYRHGSSEASGRVSAQQLEVGIAEDRPAKATPEPDELGAEATTRSSTPAPDPAPSLSTPWWNRRLSSLLLAGVVTAAGAGIIAGFGVARIPLP